jgi:hypothetical protein
MPSPRRNVFTGGLITAMSHMVRLKTFDGFAIRVAENIRRNQDSIAIQWRR